MKRKQPKQFATKPVGHVSARDAALAIADAHITTEHAKAELERERFKYEGQLDALHSKLQRYSDDSAFHSRTAARYLDLLTEAQRKLRRNNWVFVIAITATLATHIAASFL